jgi:hypothetical protein
MRPACTPERDHEIKENLPGVGPGEASESITEFEFAVASRESREKSAIAPHENVWKSGLGIIRKNPKCFPPSVANSETW